MGVAPRYAWDLECEQQLWDARISRGRRTLRAGQHLVICGAPFVKCVPHLRPLLSAVFQSHTVKNTTPENLLMADHELRNGISRFVVRRDL